MKLFRLIRSHRLRATLGLLTVITLFSGCQSVDAPQPRYYLLQTDAGYASSSIEIESIYLPAYLQRASILLAVSDVEIRPARYHSWSEPLDHGIRRVLSAEIGKQAIDQSRSTGSVAIDIWVDTFHGYHSGKVLLAGRWSFVSQPDLVQPFQIEVGLKSDGYAGLVAAHVDALKILAAEIASELQK